MTDVAHMKWWGWGKEGVAFHHDDKPAFAPFVLQAVGLDLARSTPASTPDFDDLDVPATRADDGLLAALAEAVGAEHVVTDDHARVVHTYGKSVRDLVRVRGGVLPRVPDAVVYPADESEVSALLALADRSGVVVIPFGGGSNISGSLEPDPAEERPIVSLDLGRLRSVVDIDERSGLARIGAGAQGPDLEAQLNARGWTIGHFPDSFTHSTIGGWVATRSSGMQSDKYGDIADIARGLRLVRPDGEVVVLRGLPSTSTGPSVREMILGSEGRLGVITEVTAQVHRRPAERRIQAYLFPTFAAGLEAMRLVAESDAQPSLTRVSDARETGFTFATRKESKGVSGAVTKGLMAFLRRRGWDLEKMALSFVGYEGSARHVRYQRSIVEKIVRAQGGVGIGAGPGVLYDQKKFDTPYIRDFLLDRGALADVSETAGPWSALPGIYASVIAAAEEAYAGIGRKGWIMAHLSHSYHAGACLYFTFAFVTGEDQIGEYERVKQAVQQAFVDNGGTLSHHHAVGTEHAAWMTQDVSPAGVALLRGLLAGADPNRILNPGKIVAD